MIITLTLQLSKQRDGGPASDWQNEGRNLESLDLESNHLTKYYIKSCKTFFFFTTVPFLRLKKKVGGGGRKRK